jgi:hypothetical protein
VSRLDDGRLRFLGATVCYEGKASNHGAALLARNGNAYRLLERSRQQWGLSTAFGWRLTPLKMTTFHK